MPTNRQYQQGQDKMFPCVYFLKADGATKFITTSSGAHIPIGDSNGGGDKNNQSNQQDSQSNESQQPQSTPEKKEQSPAEKKESEQKAALSSMMLFLNTQDQSEYRFSQNTNDQQNSGDKHVQIKYNTDKQGDKTQGVAQVKIKTNGGGMQTFERPMNEVAGMVKQLFSKGYGVSNRMTGVSSAVAFRTKARMKAGNPHHDPLNGKFVSSGGNLALDRQTQMYREERKQAAIDKKEKRNPILIEREKTSRNEGTDNMNVKDHADMLRVSSETGGSRVFNFSQGDGSDLDKKVKFVTNTNKAGDFARGVLRVEIESPDSKKQIYERAMRDLPVLVQQVQEKKYSPSSQHRRNTQYRMKADNVYFLKAGNPNHDSDGRFATGNSTKDESDESNDSDGSKSLTHAQRETIVKNLANKMGISLDDVEISAEDKPDANGKPMADYDPESKKIMVYPEGFSHGKDELVGTLSHEAMHQKLDKVLGAYNQQQKEFQQGESLTSGKLEIYKDLKESLGNSNNRATYQAVDAPTKYADQFKQAYLSNPTSQNFMQMINESLAETERMHQMGKGGDVHSQWTNLRNRINTFAKEI